MNPITVSEDLVQDSVTKSSTSGLCANTISVKTAKTVEIWINVTAISGTASFSAQTATDAGVYKTQKSVSSITAIGIQNIVLNRLDHAIGKSLKVFYQIAGGDISFKVTAVKLE